MLYRLFIYNTSAVINGAPAIEIINSAINSNSDQEWKEDEAADSMLDFDVASIKNQIERELLNKCRVSVKYSPDECDRRPYLYVATSYARACEVLPRLCAISAENGLALYDAETNKTVFRDLIDETLIRHKLREQQIKNHLLEECKPIWNYQQIASYADSRDKKSTYVLTLRKNPDVSLENRVRQIYETLLRSISDDEKLICENASFIVSGKWYSITICVEAYKKHPNMIGFCADNGHPLTALLKRMSCYEASKWMRQCSKTEISDIEKRMNFYEMEGRYENPADRFVKSVIITKRQRKEIFDVRYSGIGCYGSEILFHLVPDSYYRDGERLSVLKIEEESASFILPFIADIYPLIYKRYYLTENHLTSEMWEDIIKRITEAKEMILHDTYNPALEPYIERFNLFVLSKQESDSSFWEHGDGYRIKNTPVQYLFEHRYEVAHLYDIFLQWSVVQLDVNDYLGGERLFNIQGP